MSIPRHTFSVHNDRSKNKNVRSKIINASQSNFNVGGKKFPILKTLAWNKLPIRKLQKLHHSATIFEIIKHCDFYDSKNSELFFDRDPECFSCILHSCLRRGKVHIEKGICPQRMLDEMEYWGIGEEFLDACCQEKLKHCQQSMTDIGKLVEAYKMKYTAAENQDDKNLSFKKRMNLLINHPTSSKLATYWMLFDTIIIIFSIIAFIVLSTDEEHESLVKNELNQNSFIHIKAQTSLFIKILEFIEILCTLWFTLELVLRMVFCENKKMFFSSVMNWIDLMAVLPYYLQILTEFCLTWHELQENIQHHWFG